jgi:pimeloyl-ACP methyl ester carboxylesterase
MIDRLFDPIVKKMLRPKPGEPKPLPEDLARRAEDVTIDGPTLPMRAWVLRPERPAAGIVLFVHGWTSDGGRMAPVARAVVARGLTVVLIDLPGHGRTGPVEAYNAHMMVQDIGRAGAWIGSRADLAVLPAGLLGFSFGGLGSFNAAARDPRWRALVVMAAPMGPMQAAGLYLDGKGMPGAFLVGLMRKSVIRVVGVDPDDYDASRVAPRLRVPVLVIHGEKDHIVPVAHGEGLAKLVTPGFGEFLRVPGVDHNELLDEASVGERAASFLEEHVGRRTS